MRGLLSAYRRSPAGGGLVLVLGAALTVLIVGPKYDQTPAIVVIAVVGVIVAMGLAGARRGRGGEQGDPGGRPPGGEARRGGVGTDRSNGDGPAREGRRRG